MVDPRAFRAFPRSHDELDGLDLHARLSSGASSPISSPNSLQHTLELLERGIGRSLANPSRLHGWRVQFLFEAVVASLGAVALIKSEDIGAGYYSGPDLAIPDYRVVTCDSQRWLVEVKNHYQSSDPTRPFELSSAELDKLNRYRALVGDADLMIAVYWSRWNLWSLVPVGAFGVSRPGRRQLSMPDAMIHNHMGLLGDSYVATENPLSVRFNGHSSNSSDAEPHHFTIDSVEVSIAGRQVSSEVERSIVLALMRTSDWTDEQTDHRDDNGQLVAIEFVAAPSTPDDLPEQPFAMHGALSSLYSALFNQATLAEDGSVKRLRIDVDPGEAGRLIPPGYEGEVLKVWKFNQMPGP